MSVSPPTVRYAVFPVTLLDVEKEMNSKRMVVFDLDGTLVDSRAALLAAHDAAWASHNLPRPSDSDILTLVGLSLRETMLRLAPDQDPDPLAEAYSIAYKAAAVEKETLFEGVHSLLSGSYRAAVATGKANMAQIVRWLAMV